MHVADLTNLKMPQAVGNEPYIRLEDVSDFRLAASDHVPDAKLERVYQ